MTFDFLNNLPETYTPDYSKQLLFFPIRHHSPITSYQLKQCIDRYQPDLILIEGPYNLNDIKDKLLIEEAKMPLAFYIVHKSEIVDQESGKKEIHREAVYYPFAPFSPEYVALEIGLKKGIETRLIDLPFHDYKQYAENYEAVVNDHKIQYSDYINTLCEKAGVKDFNTLWDIYFENNFFDAPPEPFIKQLYQYCYYARETHAPEQLTTDGTVAREQFMASRIFDAIQTHKKIMVVTGGFHTPSLMAFPYSETNLKKRAEWYIDLKKDDDTENYIIPYAYDRIDERSGYRSGILFPAYREALHKNLNSKQESFFETVLMFLHKFHKTLKKAGEAGSIVNKIEALRVMDGLIGLRGRPQIGLTELFDGVTTAYGKGSGHLIDVMTHLNRALTGKKSGSFPYGESDSPILIDFHRQLKAFRIPFESERKEIPLTPTDHQKKHHLKSLFLHKLLFLDIHFAYLKVKNQTQMGFYENNPLVYSSSASRNKGGGAGNMLNSENQYRTEIWEVQRSTDTYVDLIEASVYGATINECCRNKFEKMWQESSGFRQSVGLFIHMLKLEIQPPSQKHIQGLRDALGREMALGNLVKGLSLLFQFLKIKPKQSLEQPFVDLYHETFDKIAKQLYFMDELSEEESDPFLKDLKTLYNIVADHDTQHQELIELLEMLQDKLSDNLLIVGGCDGMRYGAGVQSEQVILKNFQSILSGIDPGPHAANYLKGLFSTARELFLQNPQMLQAVNLMFHDLEESTFLEILPELRVAFTFFTPMEQDKIADQIAKNLNTTASELTKTVQESPEAMLLGEQLNQKVHLFLAEHKLITFPRST